MADNDDMGGEQTESMDEGTSGYMPEPAEEAMAKEAAAEKKTMAGKKGVARKKTAANKSNGTTGETTDTEESRTSQPMTAEVPVEPGELAAGRHTETQEPLVGTKDKGPMSNAEPAAESSEPVRKAEEPTRSGLRSALALWGPLLVVGLVIFLYHENSPESEMSAASGPAAVDVTTRTGKIEDAAGLVRPAAPDMDNADEGSVGKTEAILAKPDETGVAEGIISPPSDRTSPVEGLASPPVVSQASDSEVIAPVDSSLSGSPVLSVKAMGESPAAAPPEPVVEAPAQAADVSDASVPESESQGTEAMVESAPTAASEARMQVGGSPVASPAGISKTTAAASQVRGASPNQPLANQPGTAHEESRAAARFYPTVSGYWNPWAPHAPPWNSGASAYGYWAPAASPGPAFAVGPDRTGTAGQGSGGYHSTGWPYPNARGPYGLYVQPPTRYVAPPSGWGSPMYGASQPYYGVPPR